MSRNSQGVSSGHSYPRRTCLSVVYNLFYNCGNIKREVLQDFWCSTPVGFNEKRALDSVYEVLIHKVYRWVLLFL